MVVVRKLSAGLHRWVVRDLTTGLAVKSGSPKFVEIPCFALPIDPSQQDPDTPSSPWAESFAAGARLAVAVTSLNPPVPTEKLSKILMVQSDKTYKDSEQRDVVYIGVLYESRYTS